jgi:hypothetical protein
MSLVAFAYRVGRGMDFEAEMKPSAHLGKYFN